MRARRNRRAAVISCGFEVHIPISRLRRDDDVKLADPIQSRVGTK
jgi:hypothetical protein